MPGLYIAVAAAFPDGLVTVLQLKVIDTVCSFMVSIHTDSKTGILLMEEKGRGEEAIASRPDGGRKASCGVGILQCTDVDKSGGSVCLGALIDVIGLTDLKADERYIVKREPGEVHLSALAVAYLHIIIDHSCVSCPQSADVHGLHTAHTAVVFHLHAGKPLQGIPHITDAEPFHVGV